MRGLQSFFLLACHESTVVSQCIQATVACRLQLSPRATRGRALCPCSLRNYWFWLLMVVLDSWHSRRTRKHARQLPLFWVLSGKATTNFSKCCHLAAKHETLRQIVRHRYSSRNMLKSTARVYKTTLPMSQVSRCTWIVATF